MEQCTAEDSMAFGNFMSNENISTVDGLVPLRRALSCLHCRITLTNLNVRTQSTNLSTTEISQPVLAVGLGRGNLAFFFLSVINILRSVFLVVCVGVLNLEKKVVLRFRFPPPVLAWNHRWHLQSHTEGLTRTVSRRQLPQHHFHPGSLYFYSLGSIIIRNHSKGAIWSECITRVDEQPGCSNSQ
jgi:hypothetical protein